MVLGTCTGLCKFYAVLWNLHAYGYCKDGKPRRTRHYLAEHKNKGLAKCRSCIYITADTIIPGQYCKCCGNRLSQSVSNMDLRNKPHIVKRIR